MAEWLARRNNRYAELGDGYCALQLIMPSSSSESSKSVGIAPFHF